MISCRISTLNFYFIFIPIQSHFKNIAMKHFISNISCDIQKLIRYSNSTEIPSFSRNPFAAFQTA